MEKCMIILSFMIVVSGIPHVIFLLHRFRIASCMFIYSMHISLVLSLCIREAMRVIFSSYFEVSKGLKGGPYIGTHTHTHT